MFSRVVAAVRAARKLRHRASTSKVPPIMPKVAPKTMNDDSKKRNHAPVTNSVMHSVMPGAAGIEEDGMCQAPTTCGTNDYKQSTLNEDLIGMTSLSRGDVDEAMNEGAFDDDISEGNVPDELQTRPEIVKVADTGLSTLPAGHPLMVRLRAILDERPPTKSQVLGASEVHLRNVTAIQERHLRAFDGQWKIDEDTSIELPERYHQLLISSGTVTDRTGRIDKLEVQASRKTKSTLWREVPVRVSERKNQLFIDEVKYVRM